MINPDKFPRISFGIIVLDGEPFTKYQLRQLYPHAYEIIIVEGGSRKAIRYAPNGHALDHTLEAIIEFKEEEDTENKLRIITRNGFWNEKDEQSKMYAQLATGDYLWQVDIDEFYKHSDIEKVRTILYENPKIDTVSFRQIPFWGSIDYCVDGFRLRTDNSSEYHRLFRWNMNYVYKTHRPPTVLDESGVDLRKKSWLRASYTQKLGIYLYHYSLLLPKQVVNKTDYYSNPGNTPGVGYLQGSDQWAQTCYLTLNHPFQVHNSYHFLSWLQPYNGSHPEEILHLWNDISQKNIKVETRGTDDIRKLLSKKTYWISRIVLSFLADLLKFPPLYVIRRVYISAIFRLKNLRSRLLPSG